MDYRFGVEINICFSRVKFLILGAFIVLTINLMIKKTAQSKCYGVSCFFDSTLGMSIS